MKIGYVRVSLESQREDRQIDGIRELCDETYVEKVSGASTKRPIYQKILKKLKRGDTLVVLDLDRAFRSTIDALLEIQAFRKRGIILQMVHLNIDLSTPSGELLYTIRAACDQYERSNLILRTKEGMAAARRRGKQIGRPFALTEKQIVRAYENIVSGKATTKDMALKFGCAKDTLTRGLKRMGLEE